MKILLDYIESIAKVFFYVAVPLAAWVALFTWKRELKGKAKHDVAKELLALVVRLRSYIYLAQLRSKVVSSRKNKMMCYERIQEYFFKTSELAVEVNVHWGKEESQLVSDLAYRLIDIDFVVSNYDSEDLVGEKAGIDKDRLKEYLKIIDGNDSEYNKETDEVLSAIENKFKNYVQ